MIAKLRFSDVYRWNKHSTKRVRVNQGGLSSTKTYSILQNLIVMALTDVKSISVVGISLPHLKKGALRDFKNILTDLGLWDEKKYNATDRIFTFANGSFIEFFSVPTPSDARGPRRDILFINEANLLPFETYRQLSLRTHDIVFIDYNPADEFHWIYDKVIDQPHTDFFKSTYLNNPFLSDQEIQEILSYKDADPVFWKVFGMGERGSSRATIFDHWTMCTHIPDTAEIEAYGIDFGENSPTSIVKTSYDRAANKLYWDQKLYQTHVHADQLVDFCKDDSIIDNKKLIMWGDPGDKEIKTGARKGEILRKAGFKFRYAEKPVNPGIQLIKSCKWAITSNSVEGLKEVKSYKWTQDYKRDLILDFPVKANDHFMDAGRYGTYNMLKHLNASKLQGKSTLI